MDDLVGRGGDWCRGRGSRNDKLGVQDIQMGQLDAGADLVGGIVVAQSQLYAIWCSKNDETLNVPYVVGGQIVVQRVGRRQAVISQFN